mmetsp:Transcript_50790/g.110204  ORF Transcript_50790/g.110204 Transcript_50790/m.110204 type:complete len:136 (+) Transcript_50790:76-483(+)|eukprot:CAMPEP_0170615696 /NCGR_PEP_ID=MMETSP0224-20130122/25479_1 /TAXON_ID=285029 /ORGANISM="Togula jolla, Strain CCCM 725" /LENGTH=135 /DNA_ID=CAMNT_0010941453 /DNA_START=70 /DNA_END=477 /DNA_ORIENTATION=+
MPRVKITIVSAKNLANKDSWPTGVSDPFCSVQLAGQEETKVSTPVIDDDLNPKWNFSTVIEHDGKSDLWFTVCDSDLLGDDFLGQYVMRCAQVKSGFSGDVPLVPGKKKVLKNDPTLTLKVVPEGKPVCGGCSIL